MSTSRDSVSKACLQAGNKNAHCLTTLKHELEVLDKEKEHALQTISHDTKQFKKQFSEQRPLSAHKSRAGSANPSQRSSNPGSGRGSPQPGTPRSPRSPRKPSGAGSKSQSSSKSPSDHSHSGDNSGVPQIVVSNEGADQAKKKRKKSILNRRGSVQRGTSASRPGSESGSDTGGSPLSQSLNLPGGRSRSNSISQPASPLVRRPDPGSASLGLPDSARGRSSSFSSIEPARRRGSVIEQWGSISERNRPTMGSFKGRRGSIDMENLLRDLSFGVQHSELMSPTADGPSVSDKQWEELKKCRYLRVPSRDTSVEDISEEN